MSSIYLSHSSKDNAIAAQVKAQLAQWGHRSVFLDFDPEDGIPAGWDWEKELYAKLRECRAVIVLCSHASMASRWCFAEIAHAKALGKEVFPLRIDDAKVDPILTSKQIINATAGWEEAYQRLEKGLLAAGLDPKDLFDWDGTRPPYPGLMVFEEQDAAIFFGRDKEIREGQALLNRLQQFGGPRFTLMLGASGSGKSSLMRAGLLPRLKRDKRWIVVEPFRPLHAPFDELAKVLSQRLSQVSHVESGTATNVGQVRDRIRWQGHDPKQSVDTFLKLIEELREQVGLREATVLLMIDQCEELLAVGANEEGNSFLAFLRSVLDREDRHLMVVATLRSDFLGSFQDQPAMRGLRVETFPVPQMDVDDFASVIEGPARVAGLDLGPSLVQAMINDTKTSDALPLLAFTLRELYEGFGQDKLLTLEEYRDQLGRLDGCIAKTAEAVLRAKPLSENQLSDLPTAFLSMVRVSDKEHYAKQPAQWNDLPASIHEVLEHFVNARLLISGGDEKGRTLEIAHEALFRAWPRLADWMRENKSFLVWQLWLREAIKLYEDHRRNEDFLLSGFRLTEALEWLKKKSEYFSPDERQFVTVSKNRKIRERVVASTVGIVVLVLIGGMAWLWQKGYTIDHAGLKMKSLFVSIHQEPEEMVVIQGGTFLQGDVERLGGSLNKPERSVTIKPFKLGKYEVTFDEYDRFAISTGRALLNGETKMRGRHPATNLSWQEAKDYAGWLSRETGKRYRLPTESEWEFAARSGAKQDVWAGTSEESQLGQYAVFHGSSEGHTVEIGSKKPTEMGLHDLSGNVWEWVEDCWHENYKDAPQDGSSWLERNEGDCGQRVIRGGAWGSKAGYLRASSREWSNADNRGNDQGFRLAQDIEP